ncbi:MAG: GTPase, partial [bacterium]
TKEEEFQELGFKESIQISCKTKMNIDELLFLIKEMVKEKGLAESKYRRYEEKGKKVGFVGRPNVGKSSLINSLLNDQRLIVSEILGTTRDSIDIPFVYNDRSFILIDTPGIRRRTGVSSKLEAYSLTRALGTIKYADIVLLVIDISEGLTRQDKRIAYQIYKNEKSCIVVANKFDIVIEQYKNKLDKKFSNQFTENLKYELANSIKEQLYLIPYAPVVFTSAKTGYQIDSILYSLITINDQLENDLSTVNLKELIENITLSLPAVQEDCKKKRIKIKNVKYYKEDIPTIKIYINVTKFPDNYKSYLSNTLRKVLNIDNVPLRLLFVS